MRKSKEVERYGWYVDQLALRRFEASGLSWPLPDDATDTVLELRPFAKIGNGNRQGHRPHRRARLGDRAPRAQTQARDAVDPVGGIYRLGAHEERTDRNSQNGAFPVKR